MATDTLNDSVLQQGFPFFWCDALLWIQACQAGGNHFCSWRNSNMMNYCSDMSVGRAELNQVPKRNKWGILSPNTGIVISGELQIYTVSYFLDQIKTHIDLSYGFYQTINLWKACSTWCSYSIYNYWLYMNDLASLGLGTGTTWTIRQTRRRMCYILDIRLRYYLSDM